MFTLIFTVFGFNIELCVFYSITSRVLGVHSFQEKQLSFSRHISQCILSVMQPYLRAFTSLWPFNLTIFCHNWQQNYQDIISSVCCIRQLEEKISSIFATNFLLKICAIIDQLAGSTSKIPYTVILTLHHQLQSDYNFQDFGHDLLQKPSAPPAFNDFFVSQTRL